MPSAASRPRSRLLLGAALAAIGFVVLGPLPAATASAIVSPSTSVRSAGDDELIPDRGARLGSVLDWAGDSVADQSDRLGSPSSLYEHDVTLPMGDDSASYLAQFFQQTAAAGAAAIVTVNPAVPLDRIAAFFCGSNAIDRPDEAQPVMPLATISVTEDMATSMRMHGLGWKSVYHHELLADGLAPEDLGTMLTQRLRWAQGTMQVFLRENPLLQWRMKLPQRLMYFATMWSYLAGYAAVVYIAAPVIFLVLGILPVHAFAFEFFVRFIPFMVLNQLLFLVAAKGTPTWRGQQYSLALFPVWIRACTTAFTNVVLGIPLGFAVTPKTRPVTSGPQWHLIRPQLIVMAVLVLAIGVGLVRLLVDGAEPIGTGVNIAWAVYDLIVLSVLFGAARYEGYPQGEEKA